MSLQKGLAAAVLCVLWAGSVAYTQTPVATAAAQAAPKGFQYCAAAYRDEQRVFLTAVHGVPYGDDPWRTAFNSHPQGKYVGSRGPSFKDVLRNVPMQTDDDKTNGWDYPMYEKPAQPFFTVLAQETGLFDDWSNWGFLCNFFADRSRAEASRAEAVARIKSASITIVATGWIPYNDAALTPAPPPVTPQPSRQPTPALTVVMEDPAAVRERERKADAARIETELALQAEKRQQAMDFAVQAKMRAHVVALQQQSRQRLAELKRKRDACKAGDKSACRVDLAKAGASNQ